MSDKWKNILEQLLWIIIPAIAGGLVTLFINKLSTNETKDNAPITYTDRKILALDLKDYQNILPFEVKLSIGKKQPLTNLYAVMFELTNNGGPLDSKEIKDSAITIILGDSIIILRSRAFLYPSDTTWRDKGEKLQLSDTAGFVFITPPKVFNRQYFIVCGVIYTCLSENAKRARPIIRANQISGRDIKPDTTNPSFWKFKMDNRDLPKFWKWN